MLLSQEKISNISSIVSAEDRLIFSIVKFKNCKSSIETICNNPFNKLNMQMHFPQTTTQCLPVHKKKGPKYASKARIKCKCWIFTEKVELLMQGQTCRLEFLGLSESK